MQAAGRRRWLMPALWLLLIAVMAAQGLAPVLLISGPGDYSYQDTYYVVAHWHYVLGLVAICLLFAVVYWALGRVRTPYRAWLAYAQFGVFAAGLLAIFSPQFVLPLQGMPKRIVDYPQAFALWNTISSAGYAVTLVGLALFVLLLVDLVWRATRHKAAPDGP